MSSEWPQISIADIASPLPGSLAVGPFGSRMKADLYVPSGVRVIRGNNLNGGKELSGDYVHVTEKTADSLASCCLSPGDLVFPHRGNIGQVGITPDDGCRYMLSTSLMKLSPDRTKADPLYLMYFFKSKVGRAALLMNASQVGTPGIATPLKSLRGIELPLPPLGVQRKISGVLSALDDRITLLRETNTTLESIAQALFKSWFVNFDPVRAKQEGRTPEGMDEATAALFPNSFEESELGLVPKGWRVVPFLAAVDLQGGAQPPASTFIDEPRQGYVRLLQIRDFSTDAHKTYIPDTAKLKKVNEDDVLIGRYGSASGDKAKDSLGRVCRGLSGAYNVALMKLNPIEVGKEFALQLVNDPRFYGYLQGVSSKAVQSGFSKAELGQYRVVVPPRELAEYFEQMGADVWQRIKANNQLTQTLATLRDTLLPRLISGQLRLPEAEVMLAEV